MEKIEITKKMAEKIINKLYSIEFEYDRFESVISSYTNFEYENYEYEIEFDIIIDHHYKDAIITNCVDTSQPPQAMIYHIDIENIKIYNIKNDYEPCFIINYETIKKEIEKNLKNLE